MIKIHNACIITFISLFWFSGIPLGAEELHIPGTVQGIGTHFEVADSEYLNIAVDSSEEISVALASIPEMLTICIGSMSENGPVSTILTLRGFSALTTYYRYEDSYQSSEIFTTDVGGNYAYVQDISEPHLIFIQPRPSTYYVPYDNTIGIWDPANRIYTLTTDISDGINIMQDDLILDGNGHTIAGSGGGTGIYLNERRDVTIKNLDIQNFSCGIFLYNSYENNLTGNTVLNSYWGIHLLGSSSYNSLTDNVVSNSYLGIFFWWEQYGKCRGPCMPLYNTLTGNTIALSTSSGLVLHGSGNNSIYNNNFIDNQIQANLGSPGNNIFSQPMPTGGNYWSNWTTPDTIPPFGIVDSPYYVLPQYPNTGQQDYYPWTSQNGWANSSPVADAGGPYLANEGFPIVFDASGSSDPEDDPLEYRWDFENDGAWDTGWSVNPTSPCTWNDSWTGTAKVEVRDNGGLSSTDTANVTVVDLAPTAAFSWLPEPQNEGAPVQFTDESTSLPDDISSWSWDFDGDTIEDASTASPIYTFMDDGIYAVTLTVTDDDGSQDTISHDVTVVDLAPIAAFSWLPEPQNEGAPVQFTDESTSLPDDISSWSWDFDGDTIEDANTASPMHIFMDGGIYTVTLTVTDDDGSVDDISHFVTILNVPQVDITSPIPDDTVSDRVQIRADVLGTGDSPSVTVSFLVDGIVVNDIVIDNITDVQEVVCNWWTFPDCADGEHSIEVIADDGISAGNDQINVNVRNAVDVTGQIIASVPGGEDFPIGNVLLELTLDDQPKYGVMTDGNGEYQLLGITPNEPGEWYDRQVTEDDEPLEIKGGDRKVHYDPGVNVPDEVIQIRNYSAVAVCPVDIYVDNNSGSYTGMYDGVNRQDIPYSWYSGDTAEPEVVVVLNPTSVYTVGVVGTGEGTFSLQVSSYIMVGIVDTMISINLQEIPITTGEEILFTHNFAEIETEVNNLIPSVGVEEAITRATGKPVIIEAAGPTEATQEGAEVTINAGFVNPDTLDTHTATVNWGDGTPEEPGTVMESPAKGTVSDSHIYADNGTFMVTLTVTDDDGDSTTGTLSVAVENVAPTVDAGPDINIDEGDTFASSGSFTDPGADTWSATVDYGDGAGAQPLTLNPDKTFSLSQVYSDGNTYTVTVTVDDGDGGVGVDNVTVTVNDLAPTASFTWSPEPQDEGAPVQFTDTSTSSPDTIASWSWVFGDTNTSTEQNPSHAYADNGAYTVTLTVTDDDGSTDTIFHTVTISNVAPTVDAGADQIANEGDRVSFSGSYSDPGADTHTIEWDFGDSGTATGTLTPTHVYADNGVYTVTLTATDDDGGVDTDTLTVTVLNVAPTVDAGADQIANEGDRVSFSSSYSDPGSTDTHTVEWDFGDNDTATGTLIPDHTYVDDGIYTVTLTVTDDDGGVGTDTLTVTVNNLPPIVDAGPDATTDEGTEIAFSGSFIDPGVLDTHTIAWDFGDSGTATGTLTPSHDYGDNGVYTVTLTVTDDDGGVGVDNLTVTVNNLPPDVGQINASLDPVEVNTEVNASADFTDPGSLDTHTAVWEWGDGTEDTLAGVTSPITGSRSYDTPGVYTVTLTVTDDDGGSDYSTFEYIVIYDPEGGFVTGGGWINSLTGAYPADPDLTGKANFGFVSKYKKGATVPTGNTQFNFKVADLNFHSSEYEWLVVAGAKAKFKGVGTINDSGNYGFMLTGTDGDLKDDDDVEVDGFRIKIWDKDDGDGIVYDNCPDDTEDPYNSQPLGGGSIVIHEDKGGGNNNPPAAPSLLPESNCLLAAFPQPANPEVWLPYRLGADCEVVIRIYDISGRLVLTLNLGHKQPGFYVNKEKAAYWDGKNEAGEQVASGVYFYTIQAGEYTATKKMVIAR